jgi:hypothetical protein
MTDDTKKPDDELAALKARVAELEAKAAPPKPFVPPHHEPIDWTARMTMPPSALAAMVNAEPRGFMRGVVGDNRGPIGPSSAVPDSPQSASPRPSAGDGTGWAREIPLGPPPGLRYVDQQLDAQDAKDRAELIRQHAQLEAAEKVTEQIEATNKQTEALAKLAEGKS